jgi:hypothetical protein
VNLGRARVVLRLRPLTDVLDLALRVCAESAGTYRKLSLALLVPALAICASLRYFAGWSWWWVWLIAIAFGSALQGAFTIAVGQLLFEEAAPTRTLLGRFGRRLPAYLGTLFGTRLLLAISAFTVALYPILWIRFCFVPETVLLEGASPGRAISRASRFVRRYGGAVFGLWFWTVVAQLAWTIGVELIGQGVTNEVFQLGEPFGSLFSDGGSLFALAGYFASIPFVATARFLEYIDIRTRKEGWDIQLKFSALAAADSTGRMAA